MADLASTLLCTQGAAFHCACCRMHPGLLSCLAPSCHHTFLHSCRPYSHSLHFCMFRVWNARFHKQTMSDVVYPFTTIASPIRKEHRFPFTVLHPLSKLRLCKGFMSCMILPDPCHSIIQETRKLKDATFQSIALQNSIFSMHLTGLASAGVWSTHYSIASRQEQVNKGSLPHSQSCTTQRNFQLRATSGYQCEVTHGAALYQC